MWIKVRGNTAWFGIVGWLTVGVIIVAAIGLSWRIQHPLPGSFDRTAISRTANLQPSIQPTTPSSTQQAPAIAYLNIKEWHVRLPLPASLKDAYYTVGSNVGTDGLPNTIWLGLASYTGCNADHNNAKPFSPIGSIIRVLPTDADPVQGTPYPELYPNGTTIKGHYYAYAPWKNKSCAEASTLKSIDSAFAATAKDTSLTIAGN